MLLNLRLKITNFYRKHKGIIFLILAAWVIIFIVNQFLKNYEPQEPPSTSYTPDVPIMAGEDATAVSNKLQSAFESIIDTYVTYCNDKNYEKVYSMLDEDCKKDMFPDIVDLMSYIDLTYKTKKVYTVQSYYNQGSVYVYRLRIFDDILATGLTGQDALPIWNELVTIDTSKKGNPICINGYVGRENLNAVYEDDNLKITVVSVKKLYEQEVYTVKVTNRSGNYLLLSDGSSRNEIALRLDGEDRTSAGLAYSSLVVEPGGTREYEFTFNKYFHENDTSRGLKFNNVRIIKSYPVKYNQDGELQDAVSIYSLQVNLVK